MMLWVMLSVLFLVVDLVMNGMVWVEWRPDGVPGVSGLLLDVQKWSLGVEEL